MKFLVLSTLVSSGLAFLPALFSLENLIKSSACHGTDHRLTEMCEKLTPGTLRGHNVSSLHGSWRQLRPKDAKSTNYQTIDFKRKFALATTLYSNGTRVELVMPFETCRRDQTMYFTHGRQFTTFSDDSHFTFYNATCSAQSFELVYASTSLRVDSMLTDGGFRVLVPCDDVFVKYAPQT